MQDRYTDRFFDEERNSFNRREAEERVDVGAKLSLAENGEIRIECDTPELSMYLQAKLRSYQGSEGIQQNYRIKTESGFLIFTAIKDDPACKIFYIANTSICKEGQNSNVFDSEKSHFLRDCESKDGVFTIPKQYEELKDIYGETFNITQKDAVLETLKGILNPPKENIYYGVFQAKNLELALACPTMDSTRKIRGLLNLPAYSYNIYSTSPCIYFDPDVLPFDKESKKSIKLTIKPLKAELEYYKKEVEKLKNDKTSQIEDSTLIQDRASVTSNAFNQEVSSRAKRNFPKFDFADSERKDSKHNREGYRAKNVNNEDETLLSDVSLSP